MKDEPCQNIVEDIEHLKRVLDTLTNIKKTIVELKKDSPINIQTYLNDATKQIRYAIEKIEAEIKELLFKLWFKKCIVLAIRLNKHEGNKKDIRIHGEAATSDRVQFNVTRKTVEDNRKTS